MDDVARALEDVVLLDGSPQQEALGVAVARHVTDRPQYPPPSDEQVDRWLTSLDELQARGIGIPIDQSAVRALRERLLARKEQQHE
jgi:hypothetical protein